MKQALASMGDLGLRKCTLTSLESRMEVQINEALERIHRFQVERGWSMGAWFRCGCYAVQDVQGLQAHHNDITMPLEYFSSGS